MTERMTTTAGRSRRTDQSEGLVEADRTQPPNEADTAERWRWRAAGIVALLGSLGAVMADLASGWTPSPNSHMATTVSLRLDDVATLLLAKSPAALLWGHYLAITFIPFAILGIWHVSVLLRSAGWYWSKWFLLSGTFSFAAGTAYHVTYGFVAIVLQTGNPDLIARIAPFFEPFGALMIVAIVATTIPLVAAILTGKTLYPRWVVAFTPASFQLMLTFVAMLLPPAPASFLIVTGINLSMAVFLAVCLATTARRVPMLPASGY